ncbi:MAG TPA: acyl-CoA dehydrogenase family protein [Dehalococcoidia bacterium]|nr:acyl-CoA dehydrogenase family protein [Dehalococcoidia bacterium]
MNFGLTDEQQILTNVARRFIDERAPIATVRDVMESPDAFDEKLWGEMAGLGWLGLIIDEQYGGAGLGFVDLAVLLEETGRGLLPGPLLSTSLAAAAISEFGNDDQKARYLPSLADGSAIGTLAVLEDDDTPSPDAVRLEGAPADNGYRLSGAKHFVHDAGIATVFVVAFRAGGEIRLAVIPREEEGVSAQGRQAMDMTKRLGDLTLDNVLVPQADVLANGSGDAALNRLLDLAAVAVTAEMVGAMARAHEITTDYAKNRIQFDQPIGKYQGVKHPLAEMYVDIETSRSLVYYAAWCVAEKPDELPAAAARAKAYASEAFTRIGIDGVGLHGAIGFTWEYDIQLYLKRSKWALPAFGDAHFHYERLARIGGY